MAGFRNWLVQLFPAINPRRRTALRHCGRRPAAAASPCAVEHLADRLLLTIDIVFDYTYDSTGFFNSQQRRDVLDAVASVYESRITDDLTAITPGGVNTWTAIFNNPSTGTEVNVENMSVAADEIIVFVGARNLTTGLAGGGHGGFRSFATPEFNQNLESRGEPGVDTNGSNDTDYALWGGTIAFDNVTNWNFTLNPPTAGQNDFFTIALHEMGHVMGFGTSESFRKLINASNRFTGTKSVAAFGGQVPMNSDSLGNPDSGHWVSDTSSTLPGTSTVQETLMDPQITTGTRKELTKLDWAALDDLGWDVTEAAGPVDYGDAPDLTAGPGIGDYNTRALDSGPSHVVVDGLFIGTAPDGDDGSQQNTTASADDTSGISDEGFAGSDSLTVVSRAANSMDVNVTNTTGSTAVLYGWIDFDVNGQFSGSELAIASVPNGTVDGVVTLDFPAENGGLAINVSSFARFRLSTDIAASLPTGAASDGEVEDHPIRVLSQTAAYDTLPSFNWTATAGAGTVRTGSQQRFHGDASGHSAESVDQNEFSATRRSAAWQVLVALSSS